MAVFATEDQFSRLSSLIKNSDVNQKMEFLNELVTVNEAATPTLQLGTVLGKVTATGKYKVSVQTAVDGSQTPAAIYIGDTTGKVADLTLVAATDTKVLALARGKVIVSKEALKLDATFNDNTKKDAAYAALKAVGILVEASI